MKSLTNTQMNELHVLASLAITAAVKENTVLNWKQLQLLASDVSEELKYLAGAFVTLKSNRVLRGCIGYILPIKPLYQTIMENGVNAALRDIRFAPVSFNELDELEVEISVLTPPTPIADYTELRLGIDGVILDKDNHSAVFLPEVAIEQGWNREQTLHYLNQKAGLPYGAWQKDATLRVFSSQKYSAPIYLRTFK